MRVGEMATLSWSGMATPFVPSPEGGGAGSEDGPWKSVQAKGTAGAKTLS